MTDSTPSGPASPVFPESTELRTRPRQERAQQTIGTILGAARNILAADGPSGLKTSRIAKSAGIPIGLIYRYFENNQAIEKALVEAVLADVDAAILDSLGGITLEDDLDANMRHLIDRVISGFRAQPGIVDLIRNVARTDHYQAANRASNIRLAEQLASIYRAAGLTGSNQDQIRHARIQAEIGSMMQLLIWNAETDSEADALVEEWKQVATAYLQSILDRQQTDPS